MPSPLIDIRNNRLNKVQKMRDLGINPYPSASQKTHTNLDITKQFDSLEGQEVTVGGRLMSWREHGHLIFGDIQDQSGRVQLYIKDETLEPTSADHANLGWDNLDLFDVGDIVEATGVVTKSQRGEVSVMPRIIRILAKSIRPLPEKWEGLKDKETLFRQRYLDMIMNPQNRWRYEKAAQITMAIRKFLDSKGFLEIQTPILQSVYGGGTAKPFTTNINALDVDYYLAISHELYLKRLITAGFEKVFNINGYFRNEGIDRTHNPEFSMLETMSAFQNYEYNMDLVEELYRYIGEEVFGKTTFRVDGNEVDFGKPWQRIQMIDAVEKYADIDFNDVKDVAGAQSILDTIGFKREKPETVGECMVKVFEEKVESQLIQPTILYGHPVEISPLAKRMDSDNRFVERFEIFIGGIEGGDNWTELNDPVELYERFKDQAVRGRGGDEEAHPMDIEFIEMMEYAMPPTSGLGPGIERLIMMYTDTNYIDDVIFFPMQRPAPPTQIQKEIYDLDSQGHVRIKGEPSETSTEQDFSKKMAIVVNKNLEPWQLTNTVGHISAYLGHQFDDDFDTGEYFITKDEKHYPRNSQYPIVILSAKPGQMHNLLSAVREAGLTHHAFIREMIETTDDSQIVNILAHKADEELEILGVGIFGENEKVDALTKKFSLLK